MSVCDRGDMRRGTYDHVSGWTVEIQQGMQKATSRLCCCPSCFVSPLISQCVHWRRDLWGTVSGIRLCISDSVMIIICLQATGGGGGGGGDGQGMKETEEEDRWRKRARLEEGEKERKKEGTWRSEVNRCCACMWVQRWSPETEGRKEIEHVKSWHREVREKEGGKEGHK